MIGILLLGENWYGSCPRACCYALRFLGCDVLDIDSETAKPPLRMRSSRAALRLFKTRLMSEYKRRLLAAAAEFKPEFLLAFKDRSSGQIRSAKCAPPALPFTTIIRTTWRWRAAPKLSCVSLTTTPSSTPSDIGTVTPASISRYAAWNSMATILKSIVVSNWTNATCASTCLGKLRWYQCSFCYIKYVQLMEI